MSEPSVFNTIQDVLWQVFPTGTQFTGEKKIYNAPQFPPDAFAAMALLLQRAGAYQYVISCENTDGATFPRKALW